MDLCGERNYEMIMTGGIVVEYTNYQRLAATVAVIILSKLCIFSAVFAGPVSQVKGTVYSHGNCLYLNGKPLCTGLLAPLPNCTLSLAGPLGLPDKSKTIFRYQAVSDKNGHYSFDSVPLANDRDTFSIKSSLHPEYAASDLQDIVLADAQASMVDFNLEISFSNTAITSNDSLSFTVSTDKKNYSVGDSIFASYTVQNKSTHSIPYPYTPGCQFDLKMIGIRADTFFALGQNRVCAALIALDSLLPGKSAKTKFAGVAVTNKMDSVVTVIASTIFSYKNSEAAIDVDIKRSTTEALHGLGGRQSQLQAISFTHDNKIALCLARGGEVSIALYTAAGQIIDRASSNVVLAKGIHVLQMPSNLSKGLFIVQVKGETFSCNRVFQNLR